MMQRSAVSVAVATHGAAGAAPPRGLATAAAARSATAGPAAQPGRPANGPGAWLGWDRHGSRIAVAAPAAPVTEMPAQQLASAAYAAALDAGSSLPLSWLSHWEAREAQRQAQRAVRDAMRGRQQQRDRQLAALLGGGGPAVVANASSGSGAGPGLPPLQRMSEMEELTWLASHPAEESEEEAGPSNDWGAPRQPPATGGAAAAQQLQGPVQLRVGGEVLSVRPLWIAVHQQEEGGPATLYESVTPLLPATAGRLASSAAPFCSVTGMAFTAPDEGAGPWRNFFVGLVGSVAADEADILWPNQVLHRDRVLFNVRNGWDVAKFLADPQPEDVQRHRDNLLRLAAERGYRRGWARRLLRVRWGEAALRRLRVDA